MNFLNNSEINIEEVYLQVKKVFTEINNYNYEHVFIDNCSKDKTIEIKDKNVKVIVNTRNFGQIRSGYRGILQSSGDATISLVALFYLIYKIIFWNEFSVGLAPPIIGLFFFSSV